MGLRRTVARVLEKISGAMIIHPSEFHEVIEQKHLRRFFDHFDVDCVWDVGANLGQCATHLRRGVGFKGPIISFEPVPEIAEELKKFSASDPLWFVVPVALDRESGPSTFNIMASNTFSSLHSPAGDQPGIFSGQNKVERQITVMRSTVAEEFPKWSKMLSFKRPFLKMDTQGNDLAVVEGSGSALQEFVGIQSELSIRKLYNDAPDFSESLKKYSEYGFDISAFIPNTAGHFPLLVETDCILFRRSLTSSGSV